LPIVHCYCFGPKNDLNDDPESKVAKQIICKELSEKIGFEITPETKDVEIFDVRDVAPKKRQYCASFRLPAEVAFRKR
jgi:tRNA (guanine37-N1)-methyltransferase